MPILWALIVWCMTFSIQAKPVDIVLWHSLAGSNGQTLQSIANKFNESQPDYVIKPIYKGDYIESLTSFAAAFRAHQPPSLVQVFEVGTATMLSPKGIVKPVHELMAEQGLTLPEESFFPVVRAYYSEDGQLMAMPLNPSVPAMFYNKDALKKVGYSAQSFPKTWDEFEVLASKLRLAGFSCAYTTAYPAWILIESFSAIHGLPMIDKTMTRALYNNKQVIHHLSRLRRWQHRHYFEYGGRTDDATVLFTSGRCPIMSQSSGGYNGLSAMVSFPVGLAAIPMDTAASARRFNNVAGGAALWVAAGQKPEVYRGIAKFFVYLAQPAVQTYWHEKTGYLPLGMDGIYKQLSKERLHPSLALAQKELVGDPDDSSIQHVGAQNQIRAINDEALETIFSGIKSPQKAMDDAVNRANHALQRFLNNTSDI